MTELNQHIMVDNSDNDDWGHPNRRKRGERHWGVPPSDFKVSIDSVETLSFGSQPRVENLGTAQAPRLKFFLPEGRPGQDFKQDRGLTDVHLGMEFRNGSLKTVDKTIRQLRSFAATGTGVTVTSDFTTEGAASVHIDATPLRKEIENTIVKSLDERIKNLEYAVSIDAFKQAVEAYAEDYRNKLLEISEMKLAFVQLQAEYEKLKFMLNSKA